MSLTNYKLQSLKEKIDGEIKELTDKQENTNEEKDKRSDKTK